MHWFVSAQIKIKIGGSDISALLTALKSDTLNRRLSEVGVKTNGSSVTHGLVPSCVIAFGLKFHWPFVFSTPADSW